MQAQWRMPEELVEIGFNRSRVVMMNEAHNGYRRCIRTRLVGQGILPTAHCLGVRHLAMEALYEPRIVEESNHTRQLLEVASGFLSQPEMRAFIQTALDLGWTLVHYEADMSQLPAEFSNKDSNDQAVTNWREEIQARNLVAALQALPSDAPLLVWCGNGHHTKEVIHSHLICHEGELLPVPPDEPDWTPMGYLFKHLSGIDPFVIDQTVTVEFFPGARQNKYRSFETLVPILEEQGGTAGFLKEEAPHRCAAIFGSGHADAFLLSTQNMLE